MMVTHYCFFPCLYCFISMVVAVPNDDPAGANVEKAIQEALAEAEALGIQGQAVTPFILKNVAAKTKGDSKYTLSS
jgi:pseudouridine-5'-phosphate glycosidase